MMWQWWQMPWNHRNEPSLAHIWTRGRWLWWKTCQNGEKTTSGLCLDVREVVVVGGMSIMAKSTTSGLRLDAREVVVGGGTSKQQNGPSLACVWMQGRWLWWEMCWNGEKNHLWLTFGCEGGGSGGRWVKTPKRNHLRLMFGHEGDGCGGSQVEGTKKTTSGLCLDAREVVVVGVVSKEWKRPPPANTYYSSRYSAGIQQNPQESTGINRNFSRNW